MLVEVRVVFLGSSALLRGEIVGFFNLGFLFYFREIWEGGYKETYLKMFIVLCVIVKIM